MYPSGRRNGFSIPHDLKILAEVFGLADGQYNRDNAYCTSWSIREEIARLGSPGREILNARADRLVDLYRSYRDLSGVEGKV